MTARTCSLLCRVLIVALVGMFSVTSYAVEVILPQNRTAFFCEEPVEIAIAGLAKDAKAVVRIKPDAAGALPVDFDVTGDGSTLVYRLAPLSLAPGGYQILIDGRTQRQKLTISRGLHQSTMYVSQSGAKVGVDDGANFQVSNAFSFGLLDHDGRASESPRQLSSVMKGYDKLIAADRPAICYMYWTGYVLHKPWGIHKEWVSLDMEENMRLFNFHVAQRLRKFAPLFLCIGTLDEPGLPWGKTPAGGSASGFSAWNTQPWHKRHNFKWTNDPGALSDKDYQRYMQLRALMLREPQAQAAADIKTVWPSAVFATDLYAPQAVGDGTDPMNQIVNDIPTTHVFADYGIGKLGVMAGMYVEKAHDPTSKIAHAMNGQLFGASVKHPGTVDAYHLMQNVLLAAGLDSNWWLNYSGMSFTTEGKRDRKLMYQNLKRVNEPAARIGPVFREMAPSDHDVAVLWSNTEIWMRTKPIMVKEAKKKHGEQISLMIADLPEDTLNEDGSFNVNAYTVGGNYKSEVMATFMAINRAGYPAHVIHEQRLPDGVLNNYKVLVLIGQTYEMPQQVMNAVNTFIKKGGTVLVDRSTTVKIDGAVAFDAPSLVGQGYQWQAHFKYVNQVKDAGEKTKEYSYFGTNHYMEQFSRDAVAPVKAALSKTAARQVMSTRTTELGCERHVAGEGQLLMVINGYESLPDIPATQQYPIWNYAPYEATYSLPIIGKSAAVYLIEGQDWKTVSRVVNPTAPQTSQFQAGEMKLYLVAPRRPNGLSLSIVSDVGHLDIVASLNNLKTPWPLQVTVTDPAGNMIVSLHRSMDSSGKYEETIPLGANAPGGDYTVRIVSPVAGLEAQQQIAYQAQPVQLNVIAGASRIFDGQAIRSFLSSKPSLTITVPDDTYQPMANKLAAGLKSLGFEVAVQSEKNVWRKALYPRVWDPYVKVHQPVSEAAAVPEGLEITAELMIQSDFYDTPTVTTADGKPFEGNWKAAGTLLTVGPKGFIDISRAEAFYAAGCKLLFVPIDPKNPKRTKMTVLNGKTVEMKTDDAFRVQWARPWKRVMHHVGAFNLVPQLPEAYHVDQNVILLGNSRSSELVRALQASELLMQTADDQYPGPGKALVSFVWSPFVVGKNAIVIAGSTSEGIDAGSEAFLKLLNR